MKCIDELKKIGIDKISAKTRITQDKLQDIIDLKYDAFNKTHARGFIQIIEREFHIDLSEWFESFNDFHTATPQVENSDEISEEVSKTINIPIESTKKDKSYIVLIALLVLLVLFFIGFFVYNNFMKPTTQTTAETPPQIQIQTQTFTPPQDALQTPNIDASNVNDSNADLASQESTQETSQEPTPIEANQTQSQDEQTQESIMNDEITITPNEPLWVGIIDLKTRKKQQFSISSKHSFSLDNDKIIRTGHSYFTINAANFNRQFLGGNNKYLLYKTDSGLIEISHDEFLKLNGGEEW